MKDVLAFVDCDCVEGQPYYDGTRPEFHKYESAAADRFLFHNRMGTTYWAVHVYGRHVLTVRRGAWIYGSLPQQRSPATPARS